MNKYSICVQWSSIIKYISFFNDNNDIFSHTEKEKEIEEIKTNISILFLQLYWK